MKIVPLRRGTAFSQRTRGGCLCRDCPETLQQRHPPTLRAAATLKGGLSGELPEKITEEYNGYADGKGYGNPLNRDSARRYGTPMKPAMEPKSRKGSPGYDTAAHAQNFLDCIPITPRPTTTCTTSTAPLTSQAPPAKPEAWSLDISVRSEAALIQTDQAL